MDFRQSQAEQFRKEWEDRYGTNDQAWTTAPDHSAAWTHTRNFMWSGRDRILGYREVFTCDYWQQVGQFALDVSDGKVRLEPALRHGIRASNQQFLDNPAAALGSMAADGAAGLAIGGITRCLNAGGVPHISQKRLAGQFDSASYPKPPGHNSNWAWEAASGEAEAGWRWFDPKGGEWRWHGPDKWHPAGHWDHNPWTGWNSPWQNVYGPLDYFGDGPTITPPVTPSGK